MQSYYDFVNSYFVTGAVKGFRCILITDLRDAKHGQRMKISKLSKGIAKKEDHDNTFIIYIAEEINSAEIRRKADNGEFIGINEVIWGYKGNEKVLRDNTTRKETKELYQRLFLDNFNLMRATREEINKPYSFPDIEDAINRAFIVDTYRRNVIGRKVIRLVNGDVAIYELYTINIPKPRDIPIMFHRFSDVDQYSIGDIRNAYGI